MKNTSKLIAILVVICLVAGCFAGCQDSGQNESTASVQKGDQLAPWVDYVELTKLDMNSSTQKLEVTVKNFIDGDTTHFNVPAEISDSGILKARYMAVNTPESTGKIEEWGKHAATFTKEILSGAVSIILESNSEEWEFDSTGERHLAWVWYKTAEDADYRCLNLELVQNGLSLSCGSTSDLYGDVAMNAYMQAKAYKLRIYSPEDDPDFYKGDAYEVDLKGLRTNISLYENKKVAFTGIITRNHKNTVYVEQYDAETDMYYGMSVYYGFETGQLLTTLQVGNEVRVVGTVTYYETGGTWQVSGLSYRAIRPDDPSNTLLISSGHTASNRLTDPAVFNGGVLTVETLTSLESDETTTREFSYAELAMSTSVTMTGLVVRDIYTTNTGGDSDGAMTLTCDANGQTIYVRTAVLRKDDNSLYTQADFAGKTIDVVGIVDYFGQDYQIQVFTPEDITVSES